MPDETVPNDPDARQRRLTALNGHVAQIVKELGNVDAVIGLLDERDQRRLAPVAAIARDVVTLLEDDVVHLAARG